MRKLSLVLLLSLLVFGAVSGSSRADGLVLPGADSPGYLGVRYHHVSVTIKDNHALTEVEQEFYNPHPYPVAGRYTFPIPPDAVLSNFEATVEGRPQVVSRQNRSQTNAILYDTVAQRRDPSLLQYADWETLTFNLNLPAGASRHMSLAYEEVLLPSGGLHHYRYVLSTERYTAQDLDEVSITVNLESSAGLSNLYSSSHSVSTERLGPNRARLTWQAENVQPEHDFELFFAPADGGFGGGMLTGQREGQGHFLFLFAPDAASLQQESLAKDIVFVIDRSGSMSGQKIEQARNALRFILNQLNPDDRFSIIGFDDRLALLSATLQPVDQQSLVDARSFVDTLSADGYTDLEAALQTGLSILAGSESRAGASKMLVFLTDGLPTTGITDGESIAGLIERANRQLQARIHVFGVGYDVNSHLLDRLSGDNNGSVTYVQPDQNLEVVLSEFYGRIANPVLTDLEISFEGLETKDVHPRQLSDLYLGSNLLLTGRYQAAQPMVTVKVRGMTGSQAREYTYQFELNNSGGHDFVPRLWATRRVGQLLDQVRVEGESAALIEEIRALGLGYGLVTPYTTFAIQAQSDGAASSANMALYSNRAALNQESGQITIQARVQNQMYQQSERADLAGGANIINQSQRSLAQISNQNVDLSLLREEQMQGDLITPRWIEENIEVDRHITFGSDEYFNLAGDPAARPYLESGANVIFSYEGQVIAISDPENPPQEEADYRQLNRQNAVDSPPANIFSWLGQLLRDLAP